MKLEELYTPEILALATDIRHIGALEAPQAVADLHSRLCGSRIHVELNLGQGRVTEFAQRLSACALAQASAAILSHGVIGATIEDLFATRDALAAMLTKGAPPPEGRFAALAVLEPVRAVPQRHDSVLLPFDAVCKALTEAGHG